MQRWLLPLFRLLWTLATSDLALLQNCHCQLSGGKEFGSERQVLSLMSIFASLLPTYFCFNFPAK